MAKKKRNKDSQAQDDRANARDEALDDDDAGEDMGAGRALGLGAAGASAVMLLLANREKARPYIIGALKEAFRFKDWLTVQAARVKEDFEDMTAEAREAYDAELARHLRDIDKERELAQRLADLSAKRKQGGA